MSGGGAGRVALVTGASRGIGRKAAEHLARAGFDVALAARTLRPADARAPSAGEAPFSGSLEETAEQVRAAGRRALCVGLDLSRRESASIAVETVLAEWGRVDVLVNNALHGNATSNARVLDASPEELMALFDANVATVLVLTQRAIRAMLERGEGGAIINVSSGVQRMDPPMPTGEGGWAFGYAALKAAFGRLAPMIHVEHREAGIAAWTLEPGGVPTETFRRAFPPELLDDFLRNPEMNLVTEDVPASVIRWLAERSDVALARSGQILDCETTCREQALLPPDRIRVAADAAP